MKKRICKAFLAFLMMFTCISLSGIHASAAETVTVTVVDTSGKTVVAMKVNKGDNLVNTFKAHPEYYKTICKNDTTNNTPVFFYASGAIASSRVDPVSTFSANAKVEVHLYKPIREIRINMKWPEGNTYTSNSGYTPKPTGSPLNYSLTDVHWTEESYYVVSRFNAGHNYELNAAIRPSGGYQPELFTGNLKLYLNGYLTDASQYTIRYWDPYDDTNYTALDLVFRFTADNSVTNFVRRMYDLCLERGADDGGLNNWVTGLMLKKKTAADIVYGFFNSAEFKNRKLSDEAFVKLCYLVMIDRGPDTGGVKYWTERLQNGVSRNFVLKGFLGSTEFGLLCKNYGITPGTIKLTEARDQNYNLTAFVARMYQLVLGRKYDVGGLNGWCSKVLNTADRRTAIIDMALGFFNSPEFLKKNTNNKTYVTILYRVFFDRSPDTGGLNDWLNRLSKGMSRDDVLRGFANSPEFTNVLKKFGLL